MADKLSKQEKQRLKEQEKFERERRKWKYQSAKQGKRKKAAKVDGTAIMIRTVAIVVAAAFVLGFAWVYGSNYSIPSRFFPVLKVGSQTVNEPEWAFYFYNQYNQQANQSAQYGQLAGMFGLVSLDSSVFGQEKGAALGQDDSEDGDAETVTWDQYLHEQNNKTLHSLLASYEQALKDGQKLSEADKAEIDAHMQEMRESAKEYAMSINAYLRLNYTPGMTEKSYRAMMERDYVVMAFEKSKNDEFSKKYSKAELQKAYEENAELYDFVDYLACPFAKQTLTAEEGEDQAALDARQAKADAETRAEAEAFLAGVSSEQSFLAAATNLARAAFDEAEAAHDHEEGGEEHPFTYDADKETRNRFMRMQAIMEKFPVDEETPAADGTNTAEWLLGAKAGAMDVVETDSQFVAVYLARPAYKVPTREYYMIPVALEEHENDAAAAKAAAEQILESWKTGEANLTSFKALANETIDEETKSQNKDVEPGRVERAIPGYTEAALDDWVFDPARKAGDAAVVDVPQGSAVMFFVRENKDEYSWLVELTQQNAQRDYEAYTDELLKEYTLSEKKLGAWFALRTSKRLCDNLMVYINNAVAEQAAQGAGY